MNIDKGGHGSWICFFLGEVRDIFVDMLECEMPKKLKDQWEFSCAGLHNDTMFIYWVKNFAD